MKSWKKIIALLLALTMLCAMLAACSKSEKNTPAEPDTPEQTEQPEQTAEPEQTEQPEEPVEPDDENDGEIVEINVAYLDVAGVYEEYKRIEDEINKITEPELGIHVNMNYWDMGTYRTQASLVLSGGETIDVMNVTPFNAVPVIMAQHGAIEIRELAETYAPEALEICGDMLKVYEQDGGLYGLPTYRLNTTNQYWDMRTDILEELGLVEAAENADSWSDLEAIFEAAKPYCDANNMYVIGGQKMAYSNQAISTGDAFADSYQYDSLGDTTNTIMVRNDKVESIWENEDFVNNMKRANTWQEKGWIYPDTMIGDDHTDNLMKQGVIFSMANNTEMGVEAGVYSRTGYHCVCPMTTQGIVASKAISQFGVCIPTTAQEPEAAMRFINALYTDARLLNLINWGVEGVDYVIDEDGEAAYVNGDPESASYHENDYMIGNQMITLAWDGSGSDFRARAQEANDSAPRSPYLGLLVKTDGLETELAALNSVYEEYRCELLSGQYTEQRHAEMVDKLYDAGLQTYIDALQTQVDAFLAN